MEDRLNRSGRGGGDTRDKYNDDIVIVIVATLFMMRYYYLGVACTMAKSRFVL
jgi:hypothetical protein